MMGSLDFLPTKATERGEAVPEHPASFQVSMSDLEDFDSFFLDQGGPPGGSLSHPMTRRRIQPQVESVWT